MEKDENIKDIENKEIAKTAEPLVISSEDATPKVAEPLVINAEESKPVVAEPMVISQNESQQTVLEPTINNENTTIVNEPPVINSEPQQPSNEQKTQKGSALPKIIIIILLLGAIAAVIFFLTKDEKEKEEEKPKEPEEVEINIEKIVLDENMTIDYKNNVITLINSNIDFDPGNRKLFSVDKNGKYSILLLEIYSSMKSYDLNDDILYYSDKEYNLFTYDFNTKENKDMEIKLAEGFWSMTYISKDKIGLFADKENIRSFRVYDLNSKKETLYDIEVGFSIYTFKDNFLYYVNPENELHKINLDTKKDEKLLENVVMNSFKNDKAIYQQKDNLGYFIYDLKTNKTNVLIEEANADKINYIFEVNSSDDFYYIKNNNQMIRNYKGKEHIIHEIESEKNMSPYLIFDKYFIFDTYKEDSSNCAGAEICGPTITEEKRYILDLEKNTYKPFDFVYEHPTN